MALAKVLDKMELENPYIALAKLDNDSRVRIMEKVNSLDVKDSNSILEYGVDSSKKLREFTHAILESTKVRDNPEVEGLMLSLVGELNQVNTNDLTNKKKGILNRLFKQDEVKQFITKYETVEGVVKGIAHKLDEAKLELKKDIEHCNRFGNSTLEYIKALDEDILVAKIKLEELKSEVEKKELTVDLTDQMSVYELEELKSVYNRLDKRVYDLTLVRAASVLTLPQIKLIRDGNEILVDKLTTSITTAIPMWEQQVSIAIQVSRQKNAQLVQKAVTDTTNKLITQNSELIMAGTIEIAKEMERGVIDVTALKTSTENLIKTISEVRGIQKKGIEDRQTATLELGALQNQLNSSVLKIEA